MADRNVQEVKQTGMLWTISAALGIIRDVLLIVTLVAVIVGMLMIGPKLNAALGSMGSGGFAQAGQQYGGPNGSQTVGGVNIQEVALRMKGEADSGNWEAAMGDMNILNGISSQLPSEAQDGLRQLEQDIRNHDKASFDAHFDALMQKYNSQPAQNASQSGSSLLGSILSHIGASDYKATYDVTASGNSFAMVEYAKNGNTRYDMDTMGVSTEIFMVGGKTYSCTQLSGGFVCMNSGAGSVPVPALSAMASSISSYAVNALPGRNIAGIEAKCFTLSGGGNSGDYCFSNDGILLSLSTSSVSMTATSVERGISDSVFELPAAVG
jgi:hypothetical protein